MGTSPWTAHYLAAVVEYKDVNDGTHHYEDPKAMPPLYVLSPSPHPASYVESTLAAAHGAATEALAAYKRTIPQPTLSSETTFSAKSTESSFGEWSRARARERDLASAYQAALTATMAATATAITSAGGLRKADIPYLVHLERATSTEVLTIESCTYVYEGYEWLKDPASQVPMTEVYLATFDLTSDLLVALPGPIEVLSFDATIDYDHTTLAALLQPINAYIEKSRAVAEVASSLRAWATSLSEDQIDELSAGDYVLYQKFIPSYYEITQAHAGVVPETQEQKELAILDNRLLRHGLVRVSPSVRYTKTTTISEELAAIIAYDRAHPETLKTRDRSLSHRA
jgi:hypothetical protein